MVVDGLALLRRQRGGSVSTGRFAQPAGTGHQPNWPHSNRYSSCARPPPSAGLAMPHPRRHARRRLALQMKVLQVHQAFLSSRSQRRGSRESWGTTDARSALRRRLSVSRSCRAARPWHLHLLGSQGGKTSCVPGSSQGGGEACRRPHVLWRAEWKSIPCWRSGLHRGMVGQQGVEVVRSDGAGRRAGFTRMAPHAHKAPADAEVDAFGRVEQHFLHR